MSTGSEKLLNWLNNEVRLSKQLSNLEEEFANGYHLGELLHTFELITSFSEFKNSNDKDVVYHNYYHVDQALRNLNIPFSTETSNKVQSKKKDQISQILFLVKMYIEDHKISLENLKLKKSNNFKELFEKMKFGTRTEKFESIPIEVKNQNDKGKVSNKPFTPFQKFHHDQEKIIIEDEKVEHKIIKSKQEGIIKNFRDAKINRKIFLKEKDQSEEASWKKSMQKKQEMEQAQKEYHDHQAQSYQNVLLSAILESQDAAQVKIEIFNNNLSRLGLDVDAGESNKNKKNPIMSAELAMQKMREKVLAKENARKEKERRQRKMNLDQRKAKEEMDTKKAEMDHIENLNNNNMTTKKITAANYEYKYNFSKQPKNASFENSSTNVVENIDKESDEIKKKMFLHEIARHGLKKTSRELELKKKKKEASKVICDGIFDLLFDLTEECYNVQKTTGKDLIEVNQWRDYMQMFINNVSTKKNENYFGIVQDEEKNNAENEVQPVNPIDEAEMFDYVFCMGSWATDIFDISTTVSEPLKTEKNISIKGNREKGFGNKEKPGETARDKEEDEALVLRELQKNYLLGDCIETVLDLKYSTGNQDTVVVKPAYEFVPIKICLSGKPFCGKKTQAKILTDNLPLKVYSFDDLAKKALDILEKLEIPIEAHPKYKTFKKPQIDQMIADKALEEQKYAEVKKQALIIRESRNNGEPVPDEIIIAMLLEEINKDFPEKSNQVIVEEVLAKNKKKKELEAELAKIKEEQIKKPKNKLKEEQNCLAELAKLTVDNRGFIITDFPTSYNQIKLLENMLTGYIPEIDKPVTDLILYKDSLSLLMDTTVKPKPKRELVKSVFDLSFNITIDDEECIRRAVGRRIDPNTGNIYHLEDNPPDPKDLKLIDRLKPIDDENKIKSDFFKLSESYGNNYLMLKNFEEMFGDKENNLKMYNEVNGKQKKDEVQNNVMEVVNKLIAINQGKEEAIINQVKKTESDKTLGVVNASKVETKKNLVKVDIKDSKDSKEIKKNVVVEDKNVDNTANIIDNANANTEIIVEKSSIGLVQPEVEETELVKYEKKFEEIKKTLLPQQVVIDTIVKSWFKVNENYNKDCKAVFKSIKKQKENLVMNFKRVQEKYYEFLIRPSKKHQITLDFQIKYNKFLDDYPEMRDDPRQKEDFHIVIDELSDKIWDSIEVRKIESTEERKKIMESGYIETELEKLYANIKKLFQAEVEKFITSILILRDYYFALDLKSTSGLNPDSAELFLEEDKEILLETKDHISFPKLDKLYHQVLQVQTQVEKISNLNMNPLKPNPKVHDPKDKKKKTETVKADKKLSSNEEELLQAFKNEKNKFKFRVNILKLFSLKTLQNFRKISDIVYQLLDDWIVESIKLENDSMNNLIEEIRTCIDNEEHFRFDPSFDAIELNVNIEYENFLQIMYPSINVEDNSDYTKYDVTEMAIIVDELKTYEVQKDLVRKSSFLKTFLKKYLIGKSADIFYGIPLSLRKLSFQNYQRFLKFFEVPNTDLLNIRMLSTFLFIIQANILTLQKASSLFKNCESLLNSKGRITKTDFINVEMWIDESESNVSAKVKELIFDLNKESDDTLILQNLIDLLTLKTIGIDIENDMKDLTYFDILFSLQ